MHTGICLCHIQVHRCRHTNHDREREWEREKEAPFWARGTSFYSGPCKSGSWPWVEPSPHLGMAQTRSAKDWISPYPLVLLLTNRLLWLVGGLGSACFMLAPEFSSRIQLLLAGDNLLAKEPLWAAFPSLSRFLTCPLVHPYVIFQIHPLNWNSWVHFWRTPR